MNAGYVKCEYVALVRQAAVDVAIVAAAVATVVDVAASVICLLSSD
jgi:hypothetical protein